MKKILFDFLPVHDIVCSLLEKPFSDREESDQRDVVEVGRPKATICGIKRKADSSGDVQYFKGTWYNKYDWICGSTYLQNIHCWPCLLFAEESDRWVYDAFYDVSHFNEFDKHSEEESHIACDRKLIKFKRQNHEKGEGKKSPSKEDPNQIPSCQITANKTVRLNRQCTQFAVDAILLMVKKQLPLVQENEFSPWSYADLFHLLLSQSPDEELKNHYQIMEGAVNPIFCKNMLKCIVESVHECILQYIQNAVRVAEFFSLRIDDGLDESSDCALFIRIVNPDNELKEFFLGSYSLGNDKTSLSLFRILDSVLDEYQYKSKLIGIGFDITCIKFNYLKDLCVGMKFMARQSTKVNLLGHSFDYIVEKCLRRLPSCRQFFADLEALYKLFKILVKRNYCPSSGNWLEVCNSKNTCCSKFKLLSAMLINWSGMIKFFRNIQQDTALLEDISCLVCGIPDKLKQCEFIFLAVVTRHILDITNNLDQELLDQSFKPWFCQERVKNVCVTLYRKRTDASYNSIYKHADQITRECSEEDDPVPSSGADSCYKPLFFEMLDNVIMELHTRFENTDQYTYFEIGSLFYSNVDRYFVRDRVKVVTERYPKLFDDSKNLERQLCVLVHQRRQTTTPLLNVIHRLRDTNPKSFTHAYRLLSLITLQTPSTQKFPCLHEFSNYLKDSDIDLRQYLTNILMNQDILNELNNRSSFKDQVMEKLSVKFDAIQLSVKSSQKRSETNRLEINLGGLEPRLIVKPGSDLPETTVTPSDMVIQIDTTSVTSCAPGSSIEMKPDSSMMEQDVSLSMTCEVYPADEPDSPIKIKEEPIDPDTYKQDIISSSVMHELRHFSNEPSIVTNQENSLFQLPVLIKEEPISSEEET